MKSLASFVIVGCLALAGLTTSVIGNEEIVPRITGGEVSRLGQFPATVSIDTPFNLHCTGTILNLQHVLTAASCVTNSTGHLINQFWVSVIAGDLTLNTESVRRETRSVIRMYVHINYNWNTDNNNIAVLRVNAPFPAFHNNIEPAIRNTRVLQAGESCYFAGWGAAVATENAPLRQEQRFITLPILASTACNVATVHNNRVLATMVCAGQVEVSTNTVCVGNQGGGLYCGGYLSGVLAFGVNCGVANSPPVFIDVRQYEAWINQQFTRTDIPQPGSISTPQ